MCQPDKHDTLNARLSRQQENAMSLGEVMGGIFDAVTGESRRRIERDKVAIAQAELSLRQGREYQLADYGNGLVFQQMDKYGRPT